MAHCDSNVGKLEGKADGCGEGALVVGTIVGEFVVGNGVGLEEGASVDKTAQICK